MTMCVSGNICHVSEPSVESFSGCVSKIIKQDKEESTYRRCNLMTHPEIHTHAYMHTHDKNSTAWVTTAQMQGHTVWVLDAGHVEPRATNQKTPWQTSWVQSKSRKTSIKYCNYTYCGAVTLLPFTAEIWGQYTSLGEVTWAARQPDGLRMNPPFYWKHKFGSETKNRMWEH